MVHRQPLADVFADAVVGALVVLRAAAAVRGAVVVAADVPAAVGMPFQVGIAAGEALPFIAEHAAVRGAVASAITVVVRHVVSSPEVRSN
jgi:hypothetical protein